jgi:hypothetical protein
VADHSAFQAQERWIGGSALSIHDPSDKNQSQSDELAAYNDKRIVASISESLRFENIRAWQLEKMKYLLYAPKT